MYKTIEYQQEVDKLTAVNFTREQAEAIMQHVEERQMRSIQELATTRQLRGVQLAMKQDVERVRTELKQEIADVRTELKQEIDMLRIEQKYGFKILAILIFIMPFVPEVVKQLIALLH